MNEVVKSTGLKWFRDNYKGVFAVILILLFFTFLMKNSNPAEIWFFGYNPKVPLIGIAIFCFCVGLACGWIFSAIYRKRKQERSQSVV